MYVPKKELQNIWGKTGRTKYLSFQRHKTFTTIDHMPYDKTNLKFWNPEKDWNPIEYILWTQCN